MSEELMQTVYSAGTTLSFSETETTIQQLHRIPASEGDAVVESDRQVSPRDQTDPELVWLGGPQARQYAGHWVALNPETGDFLGLADSDTDFRRWQLRGASLVFVDPPGLQAGV